MVKANAIRKKAQQYVQKRDWPKAIREYEHLIELDKRNPNLFNELGDLYLKVGNKHDAFRSFAKAVEAYTRVRLYNNAIAVCKKILRLSPNQLDIIFKLGCLRKAQGIKKEAVSYFMSYMEKVILDVDKEPSELKNMVTEVAGEMPESSEILERVSDYLLKWQFHDEAVSYLIKLRDLYKKQGDEARRKEISVKLKVLGYDEKTADQEAAAKGAGLKHAGEREGKSDGGEELTLTPSAIESSSLGGNKGAETSGASGSYEYRDIQLDEAQGEVQGGAPSTLASENSAQGDSRAISGEPNSEREGPPRVEAPSPESPRKGTGTSEGDIHVSRIVDEFKSEIKDAIDEEDYRSHYDLGMAYLEMELLPEAIHEFQLSAKCDTFKVKSLEMVGACFMRQNQPHLAIKQLEKGLSQVEGDSKDTLGLLYTLGLAYEMMGDKEKAKGYFEDVYVVDVAFRDVADKIKQYNP